MNFATVKEFFNNEVVNPSGGVNVWAHSDRTKDWYLHIWTEDLKIFDLVEEKLIPEEVPVEEYAQVENKDDYSLLAIP